MKHYTIGERYRRWKLAGLAIIITVVLALGVGLFIFQREYHSKLRPVSTSQKSVVISVPAGATTTEIATKLEDQKLIQSAWAFQWYVRISKARDNLQAGTYALRPSMSVQEIVGIMTEGKI